MTRRRGLGVVLRLLPASWRDTVHQDIEEEARARGRGATWCAWQTLRVALKLRWALSGDTLMSDVRYSLRALLRARWFTAGAALTFALGIGVNVAVFSVIDRMLLRPLPYHAPGDLVIVAGESSGAFYAYLPKMIVVGARQAPGLFTDIAFAGRARPYATNATNADTSALALTDATYNVLSVLGVRPVMGRDFTRDDALAHANLVLLRYETWQQRLGGAADIIGRSMGTRTRFEVVGVLPKGFVPPTLNWGAVSEGLILVPMTLDAATASDGAWASVARLQPDVSVVVAQQKMDAVVARTAAVLPVRRGVPPLRVLVTPLQRGMFRNSQTYLWLVLAMAGMVLVVACANLANLLLARGRSRESDLAVRAALGASPARLLRASLMESLILSVAGSGIALLTLAWMWPTLLSIVPGALRQYAVTTADPRVLGATLLVTTFCAIVVGVLPGVRATRVDVLSVLQRGTRTGRGGRTMGGRSLLVVEAALGVILVAGAAVMGRGLAGLLWADMGFDPNGLYTANVTLAGQPTPEAHRVLAEHSLALLRTLPPVQSAAGVDSFSIGYDTLPRPLSEDPGIQGGVWQITAGYFETIGTRVLAGRTITDDDSRAGAAVAVISVNAARELWPGADATQVLGRVVRVPADPDRVIVGVVADRRTNQTSQATPGVYVPFGTSPKTPFRMEVVVRARPGTVIDQKIIADLLRPEFGSVAVSVYDVRTFLAPILRDPKFQAGLFGLFGIVALVLTAVGLYAVMSVEVALREYEVGVRLSLGASARDIRHMVIREGLGPVVIGVLIGLVGAWWAAQFIQAQLYGVDARNLRTLAVVAAVLLITAVVATWLPARRAGRVDPAVVLRAQ